MLTTNIASGKKLKSETSNIGKYQKLHYISKVLEKIWQKAEFTPKTPKSFR
jgi:hypothetical protein